MYTVDIDIGGTLTDGLIYDGSNALAVKVDTTPHDFTVCFMDCLHKGAEKAGFENLSDFLAEVEVLRWSSTITTNVLAEKKGPKLGLLVAKGQEANFYGREQSATLGEIIDPENVIGLENDSTDEELLGVVKKLLENGVRRICISLNGALFDDSRERRIKKIIQDQYLDHYVGAVPVLTGSELIKHPDDQTRTHMALINAYIHGPLAVTLFKAEDEVKDKYAYERPLLIGNVAGGVARISKTRAADTLESGPIFGIHGSAYYARKYGLENVVSLDVGGTTSKVGVIKSGRPLLSENTDIFGIPVKTPAILLRSNSIGGGSIARVGKGRKLTLGPESMGAYPGPACYDMGGEEPTLTDAFVVLGLVNPEFFLQGQRNLDVGKAIRVITDKIASPLGISVKDAAEAIVDVAAREIAAKVSETLGEAGVDGVKQFGMFAFGGNGALLANPVAAKLGIKNVWLFNLGPVFSTLGSSVSDITHRYEHAFFIPIQKGLEPNVLSAVKGMLEEGKRDLRGEGFDSNEGTFVLEVELEQAGSKNNFEIALETADTTKQLEELIAWWQSNLADSVGLLRFMRLTTQYAMAKYEPQMAEEAGTAAHEGVKDQRMLFWDQQEITATIYDWEKLTYGNEVEGPAVIEGSLTTYFVQPGWILKVDQFHNGLLYQKEG
ncbi:hydantoinase/oxoprolinase family protein [Paradesulfitobacterium ferrireducens]|uniref:hydantoinase/oxoprolinase family protein n=1 Tax=Paradesulfitobacterium ferrireducens TaxID=2816476 RepID=UPI001A8CB61D|nr:hydantoinase/oxoprolinase family protein [Paradesulfitobacterium ferrireducens]